MTCPQMARVLGRKLHPYRLTPPAPYVSARKRPLNSLNYRTPAEFAATTCGKDADCVGLENAFGVSHFPTASATARVGRICTIQRADSGGRSSAPPRSVPQENASSSRQIPPFIGLLDFAGTNSQSVSENGVPSGVSTTDLAAREIRCCSGTFVHLEENEHDCPYKTQAIQRFLACQ